MESFRIQIHNIKNIVNADIELPFDNGLYAFVGENGCGKSTLMLCIAQSMSNQLDKLSVSDASKDSFVKIDVHGKSVVWKRGKNGWSSSGNYVKLLGLYEGSLFYGTRFNDSTCVETLIEQNNIGEEDIADADDYVKQRMSYVLHGDMTHYSTLKRIKNRDRAKKLGFQNLPYFISIGNHLISQYRMSSGECMLVSLLHFIYNSIVRKSIPESETAIVLIDELELALHPIAVKRLIDLLNDLVQKHSNFIVYLSSHSPEVIKSISPQNLFKINNENGTLGVESNCYPSYLIRDLYTSVSPDYLLLVEDRLAQLVVEKIIQSKSLRIGKLIHCVPVGGWRNVLSLHKEIYSKKILGTNTRIVSILDGDIEEQISDEQKKLHHLFLPVPSVEKFLYNTIIENKDPKLKKVINDKFFLVTSLSDIVSHYHNDVLNGKIKKSNKTFYSRLVAELHKIGTEESVFVQGLCDEIMTYTKFNTFTTQLSQLVK